MQLNVLNDLAKAKRRWTEKNTRPSPAGIQGYGGRRASGNMTDASKRHCFSRLAMRNGHWQKMQRRLQSLMSQRESSFCQKALGPLQSGGPPHYDGTHTRKRSSPLPKLWLSQSMMRRWRNISILSLRSSASRHARNQPLRRLISLCICKLATISPRRDMSELLHREEIFYKSALLYVPREVWFLWGFWAVWIEHFYKLWQWGTADFFWRATTPYMSRRKGVWNCVLWSAVYLW